VLGIEAGEYARVQCVDRRQNLITVERTNGEHQTYDPRRLQGVTLYREAERAFAEGDRVQFTAPYRQQQFANRELGTIENIEESGRVKIHLDSGRSVEFNLKNHPHLDYGYAVTSHSSQGQTADRVLIHVDSEQAHPNLINGRMAYVSVSRARYDAHIYTNDKTNLAWERQWHATRHLTYYLGWLLDGVVLALFWRFISSENSLMVRIPTWPPRESLASARMLMTGFRTDNFRFTNAHGGSQRPRANVAHGGRLDRKSPGPI